MGVFLAGLSCMMDLEVNFIRWVSSADLATPNSARHTPVLKKHEPPDTFTQLSVDRNHGMIHMCV